MPQTKAELLTKLEEHRLRTQQENDVCVSIASSIPEDVPMPTYIHAHGYRCDAAIKYDKEPYKLDSTLSELLPRLQPIPIVLQRGSTASFFPRCNLDESQRHSEVIHIKPPWFLDVECYPPERARMHSTHAAQV